MRELARRAARQNREWEHGLPIAQVAIEIADDVATLETVMDGLGVNKSRVKSKAAVVGERLGRLKGNGHVRSYSPLSRFAELEFLLLGIEAKKRLWQSLRDLAQLPDVDFDALIARADAQRAALEPARAAAGAVLRTG